MQDVAKLSVDLGEHRLMGYLEYMIKDETDNHRIKLFRAIEEIQNSKQDPAYIVLLDKKLHCKYKELLENMKYKDWKEYGD